MKLPVALTFAILGIATAAHSQNMVRAPRYGMAASQEHSPGGQLLIGYSRERYGRWISESYVMPFQADTEERVVFVRQALDSFNAQEQIRWADSRRCEGLIETLTKAESLEMPQLVFPINRASMERANQIGYPLPAMPDGPGPYVFWAPAFGLAATDFQLSAYRGPWHDWADEMERVLGLCWQAEQPKFSANR